MPEIGWLVNINIRISHSSGGWGEEGVQGHGVSRFGTWSAAAPSQMAVFCYHVMWWKGCAGSLGSLPYGH